MTQGGHSQDPSTERSEAAHSRVPPGHRKLAKRMRRTMTDRELKLWNSVRAHRLMGLGFRRQLPIAGYIVDFACSEHKFIVEVDRERPVVIVHLQCFYQMQPIYLSYPRLPISPPKRSEETTVLKKLAVDFDIHRFNVLNCRDNPREDL